MKSAFSNRVARVGINSLHTVVVSVLVALIADSYASDLSQDDCASAASEIAAAICLHDRNAAGEAELERIYALFLAQLNHDPVRRAAVRHDQREWLRARARSCGLDDGVTGHAALLCRGEMTRLRLDYLRKQQSCEMSQTAC